MARPGKRIGIEGERAAPHRRASRGVQDSCTRSPPTRRPLDILPFQILEVRHQTGDAAQPLLINRFAATLLLDPLRDACQRHVVAANFVNDIGEGRQIPDVDFMHQFVLDMLLESLDQVRQVGNVSLHSRLHQGLDGRGEQVQDALFAATEAGTVAAGKRRVVSLVQQDRFQRPDALFDILHANVLLRRGGKILPEIPVSSQMLHRRFRLRHGSQRVIVADLHAFHASFAGVGIHGDAQQTSFTGGFFFLEREVGT